MPTKEFDIKQLIKEILEEIKEIETNPKIKVIAEGVTILFKKRYPETSEKELKQLIEQVLIISELLKRNF